MAEAEKQRDLDETSKELIEKAIAVPQENRTKVDNLYFDVAVGFKEGQPLVYRLIWICFVERKLRLVRHRKIKEEYGLYTINYVSKYELNKIKLIIGENFVVIIQPQSLDDLNALFKVLRTVTLNHNIPITKEEYLLDTLNLKKTFMVKKRGKTFWNKRVLDIYNGAIYLYENNIKDIPLTILPINDSVTIKKQSKGILEFVSLIRDLVIKFENDNERDEAAKLCKYCCQYSITPYNTPIKDFFCGNLNDLIAVCRELCLKNYLYPEEGDQYFPVLCEILKSTTKKRYATMTEKRAMTTRTDDASVSVTENKKHQSTQIDDGEELATIAEKEDPKQYFTNFVSIGKGGFGEVFVVTRKDDGKQVALKILKHGANERFSKIGIEVARLYHWKHPNIVGFEGCWIFDNRVYIGMEYCSQGTLKSLLKTKQRFNEPDTAFLVRETLRALQYIHEYGFIHRDIKTANIMLSATHAVKVIDFGLVVRASNNPSNRAGSKAYMAPEVIKQEPYDCRVDIWSVGCVAQELIEGNPPYKEVGLVKGTFKTATIGAMGLRNPTKVSKEFKDFIEKCFVFDFKKRPQCEELLKVCLLFCLYVDQ
ncbi:serine/threonine-protein kinase, putative [Entamoeba histolytica HM-1:IMSS-B]|uniref:Serine/threonine-protein kinase, putative n=5 Tax=Entamoeba histolytica TaxID=5759 RepID=C4M8B6_ENTH1|nr:serine/threonine-protein kinase, putative [Entamoeba histolytica HM-1:IMSS]EMD43556.1 serine/threonineprotein kinase, putative [Entamoeba histolytica KU27]EMH75131.1 serine/threonine-protein kinase, putative [Entamoeba histolytica HM-1:IMSS-B]EMS15474.1 serine/threonine-protein kinase [Entamoeba histolytica HM-3:IMSS]ENY62387.1 serine/threonine-protein kinase, putative [Entamoeba histolytica HM-1:IMSS-A]EAL51627.1 serine/threonine-protein kinase, putative [Entamoeba histolytica HM-1:IMSS]|eukprot:XP_657013.1 serine/threonine-protein kinase, putative [Entamoeba histolytica HM-1:IMSS]